jgi:hypothetical protein
MGKEILEMKDLILVTGCARSGTSVTSGILNRAGAWGGVLAPPNRFNEKGMFENKEIRNGIVKPLLRKMGVDPLCQDPLPDIKIMHKMAGDVNVVSDFRKSILNVFKRQGYTAGPVFYKGAKMCLMWPLWHTAFPKARWVITHRNPQGNARSCLKTSFMKAFKNEKGWMKWIAEHELRFVEMAEAGLDIHDIDVDKMVHGDLSEIKAIINDFGLLWDEADVQNFIDPKLWEKV